MVYLGHFFSSLGHLHFSTGLFFSWDVLWVLCHICAPGLCVKYHVLCAVMTLYHVLCAVAGPVTWCQGSFYKNFGTINTCHLWY
jgi:hypothetical protein